MSFLGNDIFEKMVEEEKMCNITNYGLKNIFKSYILYYTDSGFLINEYNNSIQNFNDKMRTECGIVVDQISANASGLSLHIIAERCLLYRTFLSSSMYAASSSRIQSYAKNATYLRGEKYAKGEWKIV